MAYTPTEWKDHILTNNNYRIIENSNGTVTIIPAGEVETQGTPMSAENFNHMEQGIKTLSDEIGNVSKVLATIVEVSE